MRGPGKLMYHLGYLLISFLLGFSSLDVIPSRLKYYQKLDSKKIPRIARTRRSIHSSRLFSFIFDHRDTVYQEIRIIRRFLYIKYISEKLVNILIARQARLINDRLQSVIFK